MTTPVTILVTSLCQPIQRPLDGLVLSPDQVISEGPGYHGDAVGDGPGRSALQLHRLPDILLQESRVEAVDVNSDCILYLTGHIYN